MSFPQWKGLFDWSMKYQDGTKPSDWDPSEYDPDKMRWLEGVLKHYMQDFAVRMKEIKQALDTGTAPSQQAAAAEGQRAPVTLRVEDKEELLDELMDIVSSIDHARDLHKIGGLATLLDLLTCGVPSLQWRAAEVVATCVANNPPVQEWFLQGGALPALMALAAAEGVDEAAVLLRVKALLALSGLVRHCAPALSAFLAVGGAARLVHLAADLDPRVQRKAMSLLQYVFSQSPELVANGGEVPEGAIASALALLQRSGAAAADADVRNAALGLLQQVGQLPEGWDALTRCEELPGCLAALRSAWTGLPEEEQDSTREVDEAAASLQQLLTGPRPGASTAPISDHVPAAAETGRGEPATLQLHLQPGAGGEGHGERQLTLGLPAPGGV